MDLRGSTSLKILSVYEEFPATVLSEIFHKLWPGNDVLPSYLHCLELAGPDRSL